MRFIRKQKRYVVRKKFLLWPRRLYSQELDHKYKVTLWLEEVTWQKTKYFPAILFEDCWYTVMPVGVDIYV